MSEVPHAEITRLLQSKRNEFSSIVTSRKRKLRELFAVATHVETLPQDAFANPDAPSPAQGEWQFLQENDVLKGRKFNETTIPGRPQISVDILRQSLVNVLSSSPTNGRSPASLLAQKSQANVVPATKTASHIPAASQPAKPSPPVISQPPVHSPDPLPITTPTYLSQQSTSDAETAAKREEAVKSNADKSDSAEAGRPTQVSFPPGLKDSPSAQTTEPGKPDVVSKESTDGAEPSPKRSTQQRSDAAGLSLRLSGETSRMPDALSSPASTTHSATTPAVHDASTDTSPDNEEPQYVEPDRKGESDRELEEPQNTTRSEAEPEASSSAQDEANATAEDQLLQESMLSNSSAAEKTASVPSSAEQGDSDKKEAKGPAEIPDSEDERPDRMDVDGADIPAPDSTTQDTTVSSNKDDGTPRTESEQAHATTETLPASESNHLPERAVTRVSSGAMRLKSVSEIVGDAPRSGSVSERQNSQSQLTPVTSTPQTPTHRPKQGSHKRDHSKSHVSTVLFGKQPKRNDDKSVVSGLREPMLPSDDYFTPLFLQGFAGSSKWMQPMEKILFHANKTIGTPDVNLAMQDSQACKILRRVYTLQQQDKWSLRQPKRCPEPARPTSHWDVMLREMKWMRTDFREERKWRMAVAKNFAHACAEWNQATTEERLAMQVSAYIPPKEQVKEDVAMEGTVDESESRSLPELVSSGDIDSPQHLDELTESFVETVPPSAIFTMQEDDVVFGLRRTPAADQLLDELPMFGAPLEVPKYDLPIPDFDPDAHWRRLALPLSKYVDGPMKLFTPGPPRKKGRYDYESEDMDDENESGFVSNHPSRNDKLPPDTDEVALFSSEQKHIRDRLHAGHQFRPPSEHPMPAQGFFECRNPSQWTVAEDDELRSLVREYSYNWALISSLLSTRSLFTSGAERRTPWECFERWIGLEGLPNDLQRTQYFKAYNGRIEAAQRLIAAQNAASAQQASASGAVTPIRKRQSTPIRVERRRNQKHLTMIDAMRKLAKKRETTLQKQQHNAAQNGATKKSNDNAARGPPKTPRDYSLLRFERDQALADKMAQYAQRQEATRRANLQARAQNQAQIAAQQSQGQAQGGANGQHPNTNGVNGANRGNVTTHMAAQVAAAAAVAQARPRVPMQVPSAMAQNGIGTMNGNLAPPAQMTAHTQQQFQALQGQQNMQQLQGQHPSQQQQQQLMMQARRLQEQQRLTQMQQQAQHQNSQGNAGAQGQQQGTPPMRPPSNIVTPQNFVNNNQAMMTAGYNVNGNGAAAAANGLHMPNGAGGSPQARGPQIPATILAQLHTLEAGFRAKNPNLTQDQARQLATEHLTRSMMAQRANAMSAAAGNAGQPNVASNVAATTSPHQYAAMLRQQQQAQQAQQQAQHQKQQSPQQGLQTQGQGQQQVQQAHQQKQSQHLSPQQAQLHQQQQGQPQQQTPQQRVQLSTSPVPIPAQPQSHQRQASGSATPSAGQ